MKLSRKIPRRIFDKTAFGSEGIALLTAIFVIALSTLLVMELSFSTRFDVSATRAFSESIQADYILKSGLNLGRALLELPKEDGRREDWLGEPWNTIGGALAWQIPGLPGEQRLMVVDEDGKIELNAVASNTAGSNPLNPDGGLAGSTGTGQGAGGAPIFWKNALRELLTQLGLDRAQYSSNPPRTLGNISFSPSDQVAVIEDWIDADSQSFHNASFNGEGIESGAPKYWFYNRKLRSLSELALIPGMTLDRLERLAQFVRVSPTSYGIYTSNRINVNTAHLDTLKAIGFPEAQATEIVQKRADFPIDEELLNTLVAGDAQLKSYTKVNSSLFSVYCRVSMANVSRWLRAIVSVSGGTNRRKTVVQSVEIY